MEFLSNCYKRLSTDTTGTILETPMATFGSRRLDNDDDDDDAGDTDTD